MGVRFPQQSPNSKHTTLDATETTNEHRRNQDMSTESGAPPTLKRPGRPAKSYPYDSTGPDGTRVRFVSPGVIVPLKKRPREAEADPDAESEYTEDLNSETEADAPLSFAQAEASLKASDPGLKRKAHDNYQGGRPQRLPQLPRLVDRRPQPKLSDILNDSTTRKEFVRMGRVRIYARKDLSDSRAMVFLPSIVKASQAAKPCKYWQPGVPNHLNVLYLLAQLTLRMCPRLRKRGEANWVKRMAIPEWQTRVFHVGLYYWLHHTVGVSAHPDTSRVMLNYLGQSVSYARTFRQDLAFALGALLFPLHRRPSGYSRDPPRVKDFPSPCVHLDAAKHRRMRGVRLHSDGYYIISLGRDSNGKRIWEYVHRLLLWVYAGPPSNESESSESESDSAGAELNNPHYVALHVCDRKDCLNPVHLFWGTRSDNRVADTETYTTLINARRNHIDERLDPIGNTPRIIPEAGEL